MSDKDKSEINHMDDAPRDGREIIGVFADGSTDRIRWNEERYCMLGPRCGSYPPGWSPGYGITDSNLPIDDSELIGWKQP